MVFETKKGVTITYKKIIFEGLEKRKRKKNYNIQVKQEPTTNNQQIIPITIDLIKELKLRGDYDQAKELLKAFRESCKQQQKQDYKEITNQIKKIKRIKGICIQINCEKKAYKWGLCQKHYKQKKEGKKQYINKQKY